jgi:hypothetical protein
MAKVLEDLVDPSQTAYIPGRSVMDNLRMNFCVKNYCETRKIDALLVSLDAKKAFDSVDHNYIRKVLMEYGFGPKFIKYFNTLYNDLEARIMVNGYFSNKIKVERGVKQGDALSCSLFILCIDPLIRNINNNTKIKGITFEDTKNKNRVDVKASGYADDIAVTCLNTIESVTEIFKEYERLTHLSGLELNADKTEILCLKMTNFDEPKKVFNFKYLEKQYNLSSVEKIKICGLYFCNDKEIEYEENIIEKIERLESQLKRWMCRYLTLEGKILIAKTFGLSQLIYNLQCYHILESEIKTTERLIFKFIWSKEWSAKKAIDRIKRSVLKNDYEDGGLRAPDIESLDRALKLKQFIRAEQSNHKIKIIQQVMLAKLGCDSVIKQEYDNVSKDDWIIKMGQESINVLTKWSRKQKYGTDDNGLSSTIAINLTGSINVSSYLKINKQPLALCLFKMFEREGIEKLIEVIQECEFETDSIRRKNLEYIIGQFDPSIVEIAKNYNDEINGSTGEMSHFYIGNNQFIKSKDITVKELQKLLKEALRKTSTVQYEENLKIESFDRKSLTTIRKVVSNVKLRNIYYRLINNDFFCKTRMVKFKMIEDYKCDRCGEEENSRHLLWDCWGAKVGWSSLNEILVKKGLEQFMVSSYEELYNFDLPGSICSIKLRIINELIQIVRPRHLDAIKIERIIKNTMNVEKYIATKNNKIKHFEKRWQYFMNF